MTIEEQEQFDVACAEEFTEETREQEEPSSDMTPVKKRRINNNYKKLLEPYQNISTTDEPIWIGRPIPATIDETKL